MRLIARCLEYSPCMRLHMEDVIARLACPKEDFSVIIDSLSKSKENIYSQQIHTIIEQSKIGPLILDKAAVSGEKKILQNEKKVADNIDPLLEPAFKEINMKLSGKEIYDDPLFKKIASSKEKEIVLSGNYNIFYIQMEIQIVQQSLQP
eukprot:TRINITY_DN8541_c0_g1_i10.p1 TRINITY_DN8541_c0_g1~~TRINITY_DN8541_c0_g1_i10.p1  ORF type:complete len:149 (-),score=17.02 TRINITY_DN8541_c0_g1_i10:469-915(-)